MQIKINKELKIGIIALVTLVLFFWLANFFLGKKAFRAEKYFYGIYTQVDGLAPSDPVVVQGVKVGKVKTIEFMSATDPTILVTFTLDSKLQIPKNSTAKIQSADLLGSKCITIVLGNSSEYITSGDTLTSAVEAGMLAEIGEQLDPLKNKAITLISSLDTAITMIQAIFNEETQENIRGSFDNINSTLAHINQLAGSADQLLSNESRVIANILKNIESISINLKNNNSEISHILQNFASISDSIAKGNLSQTMLSLNHSLEKVEVVMSKIEAGEGSVGLFLNDDKLYKDLEGASASLNALLQDIKENPSRYVSVSVFGGKKKK